MTTEDAFLAAIDARPGDRMARLVYADWLDDHADPRAELVRVEEEMDRLPVFADRFWELKPRRNELRAAAPTDWLARLGYGTVCRPVFGHGWPDGWRERWRLLREFTERWHGVPVPDVGGRPAEVAEVQLRHDRPLPPSVREWIAFGCDFNWLYGGVNPNAIGWLRGAVEANSIPLLVGKGKYCGVRHADAGHPDPPVDYFVFDHDSPDSFAFRTRPEERTDSVTEFAWQCVWFQPLRTAGGGYGAPVADPDRLAADLAAALGPPATVMHGEVFEADDLLVLLGLGGQEEGAGVYVRLNRPILPDRLPAAILDRLPAEYEYRDGVFAYRPPAADDLPF